MEYQSLSSCISWLHEELKLLNLSEHTREQYTQWLLEGATGKSFSSLIAESKINDHTIEKLETYIAQLKQGTPLAYVIGWVPFCSLSIKIQPPTLIPRMETEEWVNTLIDELKKETHQDLRILDLCTGSGCIAIALAHHLPHATVIGVDIQEEAIRCAQENARLCNVDNVHFIHSDLFNELEAQPFDLIVSNPPYISESEYKKIDASVRDWEDYTALVATENGLAILKKIILASPAWLAHSRINAPQFWLEIGHTQAQECLEYMKKHGFENIAVHKDSFGNDRVVTGRINEAHKNSLSLSKKRLPD